VALKFFLKNNLWGIQFTGSKGVSGATGTPQKLEWNRVGSGAQKRAKSPKRCMIQDKVTITD